jgi:hypothetical protein
MVSNTTQYTPTPSQPHTDFGKGGRGGEGKPERRLEGQKFTKLGRKYQHDLLYLQSINSINSKDDI